MNSTKRLFLTVLLGLLFVTNLASGALVGEFSQQFGFGFTSMPPPGFTYLSISYSSPTLALFEDIRVSSNEVGETFFSNAASDDDFQLFETELTNGFDDRITVSHFGLPGRQPPGSGVPRLESEWFASGSPDLAGFDIDHVEMRLNSYVSDDRFDRVDVTFSFFTVAEPSLSLPLVLAMFLICMRCRFRHSK